VYGERKEDCVTLGWVGVVILFRGQEYLKLLLKVFFIFPVPMSQLGYAMAFM
jgi:hypothetical protein